MNKKPKIIVVDDHQVFLEGICNLLSDSGYQVLATATNVMDGIEAVKTYKPNVIICDIQMPFQDGTELIRWVREKKPWIKIIVLTVCENRGIASKLASLGLNAYILKTHSFQNVRLAIDRVMEDRFFICEELADVLLNKYEEDNVRRCVTKREVEIIKLMLNELSNKEIANKLFISERTVEAHRRNIYCKTSRNSIVGLMKWALENKVYEIQGT